MKKAKKSFSQPEQILDGVFRTILPLPGKQPGPVNSYIFIGENITLLDTGMLFHTDFLMNSLAKINIYPHQIDKIIVTHGHIDHYGGARNIMKAAGKYIPLYAHQDDARFIETGTDLSRKIINAFLQKCGMPLKYRVAMLFFFTVFGMQKKNYHVHQHIQDGDILTCGNYQLQAVHTPGHSRGSLCYHIESEDVLFSGDHIIGHITPNAFVMLDEKNIFPIRSSQKEFYSSLARIEEINPATVFSGHGAIITSPKDTIKMYRKQFSLRQQKILSLLENHSWTTYRLARQLFPNLKGKRKLLDMYLSMSEVYSHIQVLEEEGRVQSFMQNNLLVHKQV